MEDVHLSETVDANFEREPWLRPALVAPWWEIALVLTVMLGPFAYSSIHYAIRANSPDYISHMLTNRAFLHLVAPESGLLALLFFYLRWRGWTTRDFRVRPGWKGTLAVPVLIVVAMGANVITAMTLKIWVVWQAPHPHGMLAAFIAQSPHIPHHSIDVGWFLIFFGSIINAFLEEIVFMGYAFNQFAARRGFVFALMCMVFLRMLLHTYKGPIEMLGIAAFSFVFGFAYRHLGRLWPLILAHACIDIGAFAALKIFFGR